MNVSIPSKQANVGLGRFSLLGVCLGAIAAAGLWNLAGPGMWWDEGWTLSVARTWAERGFYGRVQDGQLAPPGLEAAISVTGPVALSFKLFGVGLWQGRVVGIVFLLLALSMLYLLAVRVFNRRVAIAALALLFLTPMHPQLHPLLMARQVLAETPMFAYLLLGYLCLLFGLERSRWWLALAAFCWGVGLMTKAQALPFWLVSLALPLGVALWRRNWQLAVRLGGSAAGALVAMRLVLLLKDAVLAGHTLPAGPLIGMYDVTALVLTSFNRLLALRMTLLLALPTVAALCYAAWRALQAKPEETPQAKYLVRLALLGLSASWLAWYTVLSVGVPRYLYPATFFGSVFVAALLDDMTGGFALGTSLQRASLLLRGRLGWQIVGTWLMLLVLPLMCAITLFTLNRYYVMNTNTSAQQTAAWLANAPLPGTVETYESELHFLLDRPYHYPPDQLHIELNHRSLLHEDVLIDYNPLAADPDYLVVGQFARENHLYDLVIQRGDFRPIQTFGSYIVYERAR